ncbi:LysR family transcriptional regulator [Vibrio rotiferianus]|uniref:LysR family transcriptional regulator n=1 Tax=Vibrio rotiferianus TaxID=190895 RepID=UPI00406A1938
MNKQLSRIDLNLLITLDTLLKEKNVTRTAEVLFVSQPAVSRALGRLRETFDDPLFTRVSNGLIPTEKALHIGKQLEVIIPLLQGVFLSEDFTPEKCDYSFSIALPAFLSSVLLPKLVLEINRLAPKARVTELPAKANPYPLIVQGNLDFSIHYTSSPNEKYFSTEIGVLKPQLFARKSHPLFKKKDYKLDDTFDYPLVGMLVEEDQYQSFSAPIMNIYRDLMIDKKPMLRSSQTQVLLDVMKNSNSIMFGTNCVSALSGFGNEFDLLLSLDHKDEYHVPIHLVQHTRNRNNPAHQWFSSLILKEICKII